MSDFVPGARIRHNSHGEGTLVCNKGTTNGFFRGEEEILWEVKYDSGHHVGQEIGDGDFQSNMTLLETPPRLAINDLVEIIIENSDRDYRMERWQHYRCRVIQSVRDTDHLVQVQGIGPRPDGMDSAFFWNAEDLHKVVEDD